MSFLGGGPVLRPLSYSLQSLLLLIPPGQVLPTDSPFSLLGMTLDFLPGQDAVLDFRFRFSQNFYLMADLFIFFFIEVERFPRTKILVAFIQQTINKLGHLFGCNAEA